MSDVMIIDGTPVLPNTSVQIDLAVSRLPSNTRVHIQAHVYRAARPGPTLLILAGVHGDEINGIEAARRTISEQIVDHLLCGTVIIIPLLNVFGFINFSREVPDGKDVNRSFPGTLTGSLASRVAAVLTKQILPHVDYAIDLHTGGGSRYNYPQIRISKHDERAFELAQSFGAPYIIEKPKISKSFRKTASEMGVSVLVYEAGESVRMDGFAIELAVQGIKRVLLALEMKDSAPPSLHDMIMFRSTGWVRASEAGLFTWARKSGVKIRKGEPLGVIHSPQGDLTKRITARRDG
ncbi:MAG: succinylglutamate desuccinylase/aspartoacylase family protein, partial [Bacteroidota bacterium]